MNFDQNRMERELKDFLESVNKYEIQYRALDLARYGEALAFAVPQLVQAIEDTRNVDIIPHRTLIACSAHVLGSIGRPARCAIPNLVKLLKFRDLYIWQSAYNAIINITESVREEPQAVGDLIEELTSILQQQTDLEITQRQALAQELPATLAKEPLSTMTPAEWQEKLLSNKPGTVYYASVNLYYHERNISKACQKFASRFFALSRIMYQREHLQETLDEIKKRERGGWQKLCELENSVKEWAAEKVHLIKNMYLFGSRVRDDFTPKSDLTLRLSCPYLLGKMKKRFGGKQSILGSKNFSNTYPTRLIYTGLKTRYKPLISTGVSRPAIGRFTRMANLFRFT